MRYRNNTSVIWRTSGLQVPHFILSGSRWVIYLFTVIIQLLVYSDYNKYSILSETFLLGNSLFGEIVFLQEKQLSSSQENNIGMRFTYCIFLIYNFKSFCDLYMDFLNPISAYFNTCHLPDTLYNGTSYIQHTWDWSHSRPF